MQMIDSQKSEADDRKFSRFFLCNFTAYFLNNLHFSFERSNAFLCSDKFIGHFYAIV